MRAVNEDVLTLAQHASLETLFSWMLYSVGALVLWQWMGEADSAQPLCTAPCTSPSLLAAVQVWHQQAPRLCLLDNRDGTCADFM